jgi:YD repeat-containing protein
LGASNYLKKRTGRMRKSAKNRFPHLNFTDFSSCKDLLQYTSTSTEAYYSDGKDTKVYIDKYQYNNEPEEVYTDDAAVKAVAERENNALMTSGTPFVEAKTFTEKARPSKSTTKYSYDKEGNLKTAKTTESWTTVAVLRNETYGNTYYQYDSEGKTEEVETTVTHTYKSNKTKENKVKSGTNRVKTATTIGTSSSDRATPSYAIGGRVTYTLKAKTIAKKKIRTDVELQQWMIQNPGCGSVAGLF